MPSAQAARLGLREAHRLWPYDVCANTLRWAEAAEAQLYVSHARGVEKRVETALKTLGWANEATTDLTYQN